MALGPKYVFKLHQIARFRLFSGLKDGQIATLIGLSQSGLSRILSLPEYQEVERQLLEGGITKLDEQVAGKQEEMKKVFSVATPLAMRTLIEVVQQRRDLRSCVAAAKELLDRDPDQTFVPRSKNVAIAPSASTVPTGVLAQAIASTQEVASAIGKVIKTPTIVQPPDSNVN